MKCININDSSLWYILSMYFIVHISFPFMRFFKCLSVSFPFFHDSVDRYTITW